MEDNKVDVKNNPWNVENIDQFLFYCCPECDMKQDNKEQFIIHAVDSHPNSHNFIPIFGFKDEKSVGEQEPFEDNEIKEENIEMLPEVKLEIPDAEIEMERKPKCEECDIEFSTPKSLSNHNKKLHSEDDQDNDFMNPICKKCNKEFPNRSGYASHIKSCQTAKKTKRGRPSKYTFITDPKDGKPKIQCEDCGLMFISKDGIIMHKKKYHGYKTGRKVVSNSKKQKYEHEEIKSDHLGYCILCSTDFKTYNNLLKHMVQNHLKEDNKYECEHCHQCFVREDREKFLFHMTQIHNVGDYRFKCDQCDKVFETRNNLTVHLKSHDTSRIVCDQCGKDFKNQECLKSHLKIFHTVDKITKEDTVKKCDKCDIEFEVPELLDSHLKICQNELKELKCKFCDTVWVSHLSLSLHLVVEHQSLLSVCDICGEIVKGLKRHKQVVHEKIYKYYCHLCAKPTNDKDNLNSHMINVHGIGEKMFKCDQCDKSFANKHILKHHYESHHVKKTLYQCEYCPKTFWMKQYLSTHVRNIHDRVKPNKCDICHEGFFYKRDLVSHKKQVHNIHE